MRASIAIKLRGDHSSPISKKRKGFGFYFHGFALVSRSHRCDPGRLIAVPLMHTALVSGWTGSMASYELAVFDPSDPILDPMWRQGMFVILVMTRIGVTKSHGGARGVGEDPTPGPGKTCSPRYRFHQALILSHQSPQHPGFSLPSGMGERASAMKKVTSNIKRIPLV